MIVLIIQDTLNRKQLTKITMICHMVAMIQVEVNLLLEHLEDIKQPFLRKIETNLNFNIFILYNA